MKKIKQVFYSLLVVLLAVPVKVGAAKTVSCGNKNQGLTGDYAIPKKVPQLTSFFVTVIQVAVPVVIILLGMMDAIKAITSGKEDEIKKAQRVLIRRLITGALVFFIFVIVKLLVSVVDSNSSGIIDCMDCFINGSCSK